MYVTPYKLAERYTGVKELSGTKHHPLISWWHSLCKMALDSPDEIPWCSSFVNGICWELLLPRSESAAARSWLNIGLPIAIEDATPGFDIVILKRGKGPQPGPEVTIGASGHVGFFAGFDPDGRLLLLGGNQSNGVNIGRFDPADILGVRRLREAN